MLSKRHQQLILALFALAMWNQASQARVPDEAEYRASALLGEEIGAWLDEYEPKPNSMGIFSVHANYPLEKDYSSVVEAEILRDLSDRNFPNVISCSECRAPQIYVKDERLIISKGAPDIDTLKQIGKRQPVATFLTIDVYRSKLSVIAHAVLYENPSGVVLRAQHFHIPAVSISDAAVQVLLTFGAGKPLASPDNSSGTLATAVNLLLLEELGFGKGGLNLGAALSSGNGTLIYLLPTFAFRGRFGSTALSWSIDLGAGLGFASGGKGYAFRGAYELYLGSLTVVGAEGIYFLPEKSGSTTLQGYAGLHLGLAFGR